MTHVDLIAERRKLELLDPFLWTFEILVNDTQATRIVQNNEDVTVAGNVFHAWNVEHTGLVVSEDQDEAADVTLKITNATTTLKSWLAAHNNFVGLYVIIRIVNSKYLSQGYTLGEPQRWKIYAVDLQQQVVEWKLGLVAHHSRDLPMAVYSRNQCRHVFGGWRCRFPRDRFTDDELRDHGINPTKWRVCDGGYDSENGCVVKGKLAAIMGIECHWPRVCGLQRGIKAVKN